MRKGGNGGEEGRDGMAVGVKAWVQAVIGFVPSSMAMAMAMAKGKTWMGLMNLESGGQALASSQFRCLLKTSIRTAEDQKRNNVLFTNGSSQPFVNHTSPVEGAIVTAGCVIPL